MTDQANTFARTTLFEIERASGARQEVVSRRQSALATRYPGVSVVVLAAGDLPRWLKGQAFSGLVTTQDGMTARAVAFPRERPASYAVVVDLPVEESLAENALGPAGISIGEGRSRSLFNTATFLTHTVGRAARPLDLPSR